MKTKEELINILKELPRSLCGGFGWDSRDNLNLRDNCIDMVKDVIAESKPKLILEIGTHYGSSAALFLGLSDANIISIDYMKDTIDWENGYYDWGVKRLGGGMNDVLEVIRKHYGERLRFIPGSSYSNEVLEQIYVREFDLVFVDGDHSYEGLYKDIQNCFKLNIPYILIDDYTTCEHIRKCIVDCGLINPKIYENIHNSGNVGCAFFKNPFYKKNE